MLSQYLLDLLRQWWREGKRREVMLPPGWLFPGQNGKDPVSTRQLYRVVQKAAERAEIHKRVCGVLVISAEDPHDREWHEAVHAMWTRVRVVAWGPTATDDLLRQRSRSACADCPQLIQLSRASAACSLPAPPSREICGDKRPTE